MSDPVLTREQFDYAVKQAPAGLSKEEFTAYLDKEVKRIHAGDEYGGDVTLGQDILEHKGVDTTKPPSPTMEALQHLAHPSTVSDFTGLLLPSGMLEMAAPAKKMAGTAFRMGKAALPGGLKKAAAGAVRGLVEEAFPADPNILQGAKQFAPHEIPPRLSPAAQPPSEPLVPTASPEVLQGAAMHEPGAIPPRMSPAAQAPARVPFRVSAAESPVLQGAEQFTPGNIPARLSPAEAVAAAPSGPMPTSAVLTGSEQFSPLAKYETAPHPIQVSPESANLSPLESAVAKRVPMGAPSTKLKTQGLDWPAAQRYYGTRRLSALTGVPEATIEQLSGAPAHQIPLSVEAELMDRGGPTNP